MSGRDITPVEIWSQVPVANRTIEVNTKTGFSLTAGSYAVTGSVQTGTISMSGTSATGSISSVTTAKTLLGYLGSNASTGNNGSATLRQDLGSLCAADMALTSSTVVTTSRGDTGHTIVTRFTVVPFV